MDKVIYDFPGDAEQKKAEYANNILIYLNSIGKERVMGMEDLREAALVHEVARHRGIMIPCAISVLGYLTPIICARMILAPVNSLHCKTFAKINSFR